MLGCGGCGDGLAVLLLAVSRLILGAALIGGGGISDSVLLLEPGVASKGCLDAGLFELARDPFGTGVAVLPRDSPIVIRINSLTRPSSLYVICIGLDG